MARRPSPTFLDFGFGANAGVPVEGAPGVNVEPRNLKPGQFFAEAGERKLSNIPGLGLESFQSTPEVDPTRLGRAFRTRSQEDERQRTSAAFERLARKRADVAKLSMTREARARLEKGEAAVAATAAGKKTRHQNLLEVLRAKPGGVESQQVKTTGATAAAQAKEAGATTRHATDIAATAARQEADLGFRREQLAAKTQQVTDQLQAASTLAQQKGILPGTPQFQAAQQAAIEQMRAKAEAEGDADQELAVLRQSHQLQQAQFKGEVDASFNKTEQPIPVAPIAAGAQERTAGDLNGDGRESPAETKFNQLSAILRSGVDPDTDIPLTDVQRGHAQNRIKELKEELGL